MKKNLKRMMSLMLVLALFLGGVSQMSTPVVAATNTVTSVSSGQVYMFRNYGTGLYMDAYGMDSSSGGGNVVLNNYTGSSSQLWTLISSSDGYTVHPLANVNLRLDVDDAKNENGRDVNVATNEWYTIAAGQRWHFNYQSNGTFRIKTDLSGTSRVVGITGDGAVGNRTSLRDESSDLTRYWEVILAGTVTYNVAHNGGTSSAPAGVSLFEGAQIDLNPTASKTGWEFVGWNTSPNATVGLSSLTMGSENITLYAIFKKTGTVNFVDYDGTTTVTRSVPYTAYNTTTGFTVTAPAQNSAAGLVARGWGVGTAGNAPVLVSPAGGAVPLAATYYGTYEKPITVTYDSAGGTPTPSSQTGTKYLNAADITDPVNPVFTMPAEPSRERYTFGDWTDGEYVYPAWANAAFAQDTNIVALWDEIRVAGISLSQNNLVMGEGEAAALEAFVSPANTTYPDFAWSSSDESVVAIDANGSVTAVNSGIATITATTAEGGFIASCAVTVMFVENPVTAISISQSNAQMIIGDSLQFSAEVSPIDATISDVQWSSSNPTVATVDANGFVQSVGVGTAIIAARSVQGGLQAVCNVTVNPVRVTGIALDYDKNALSINQSVQLKATVTPENATNKAINWVSSDNAIATVDQNGIVTARGTGQAEIKAITEDGGLIAKSVVTVTIPVASITLLPESVMIEAGTQVALEATVLPLDANNKNVTWSSSNAAIATVDQNGVVTANLVDGDATVVITATANDGSGVSAQAEVRVREKQEIAGQYDALLRALAEIGGGSTGEQPEGGIVSAWEWVRKYLFFGWAWQKADRYYFSNSSDNFTNVSIFAKSRIENYYVSNADFFKLENYARNLFPYNADYYITEMKKIRDRDWGGSCYGMSTTALLDYQGLLPMNEHFGKKTLRDIPIPSYNLDVLSAINYYQCSWPISYRWAGSYISKHGNLAAWKQGVEMIVSNAIAGKRQLFNYYWLSFSNTESGHAIIITGGTQKKDGSFELNAYDNRQPTVDTKIKVSSNYENVKVAGSEDAIKIYCTADLSGYENINLFSSNAANSNASRQSVASSLQATLQADSLPLENTVRVSVGMRGTINIVNAEGKTLVVNGSDGSTTGDMEVLDSSVLPATPGTGSLSTITFVVPTSEAFTFTSNMDGIEATVSDEAYAHASSETARVAKFNNHARSAEIVGGGSFDYRLFLIDNDEILYDTVNVTGTADRRVSLSLNEDGGVLLNGVAAGASLRINGQDNYSIPSGHNQVRITGNIDDVKAYDSDGNQINIQSQPLKWWQKLPAWVQWILRYICFGWIWMK